MAAASFASAPGGGFVFPPLYSFKPFFTVQPTDATWSKQRAAWLDLIRAFAAHHRMQRLPLSAYAGGAATNKAAAAGISREGQLTNKLFRNDAIDRHLSPDAIRLLLDVLATDGYGVWEDSGAARSVFLLSPSVRVSDHADALWAHMERIGESASIVTLYELTQGDTGKGQAWAGMDDALMLAVLKALEAKGKCALIPAQIISETGVKFLG